MARSNIAAIDDPYATKALAAYLNDEVDRDVKTMYIDALAKVNTPDSLSTLARSAIWDDDEEIRLVCVDRVARKNYKPAVGVFVQALKNADNGIINRTAWRWADQRPFHDRPADRRRGDLAQIRIRRWKSRPNDRHFSHGRQFRRPRRHELRLAAGD